MIWWALLMIIYKPPVPSGHLTTMDNSGECFYPARHCAGGNSLSLTRTTIRVLGRAELKVCPRGVSPEGKNKCPSFVSVIKRGTSGRSQT
jgi:hypothetical protein